VLGDSHTGHNEEGGICTRQLPDAVTILFFPNEQNLSGLKKVVSDIRNEAAGPRKKNIQLHFVNSNVPDLDDEDQILATRMRGFQDTLKFNASDCIVIHHYNSLALLNQEIFTLNRRRSRLAGEYYELTQAITQHNLDDRESALDFLKGVLGRPYQRTKGISITERDHRLKAIETSHDGDGEISYHLANIRDREGRHEEALVLFNKAVGTGYRSPEVLLRRAGLYRLQGDEQHALDDVQNALNSSEATYFDVRLAVRMLYDMDPLRVNQISASSSLAVLDFDERCRVAHELLRSHDTIPAAEQILTEVIENQDASNVQRQRARSELALGYIALGLFHDAMHAISPTRPEPLEPDIEDAFNYAMAEWGEKGVVPHDLLQRVVDLDKQSPPPDSGPNYMQCLAIAHWAVGNIEQAREKISRARQQLMARRSPDFSAWHYLIVPVDQFMADLDAMLKMINGEEIVPMFMTQHASNDSKGGIS
jgi:tetratricopeptide (TPR) repeat protein